MWPLLETSIWSLTFYSKSVANWKALLYTSQKSTCVPTHHLWWYKSVCLRVDTWDISRKIFQWSAILPDKKPSFNSSMFLLNVVIYIIHIIDNHNDKYIFMLGFVSVCIMMSISICESVFNRSFCLCTSNCKVHHHHHHIYHNHHITRLPSPSNKRRLINIFFPRSSSGSWCWIGKDYSRITSGLNDETMEKNCDSCGGESLYQKRTFI